jgi:hypothetical protein
METTIVTAFFDINRKEKGDGRSIEEYLQWIKKTLLLNCKLYVVTEKKFVKFIEENRPKDFPLIIREDVLENSSFYKYKERMEVIINSEEYKRRIAYPNRVECKLADYNIIQYGKFGWLNRAIKENPYNTNYFFWMDIGISRFFYNMNPMNSYPSVNNNLIVNSKNTFIVQQRDDLQRYNIDENFIWKADNLFKGGMFGGYKDIVLKIEKKVEEIFEKEMLEKNNVNNEQLALAILWKKEPDLFNVIGDIQRHPCIILHLLNK